MTNTKFDLAMGQSVAVRKALLDEVSHLIFVTRSDLFGYDYPPFEGDPELIRLTREVIKRQTGKTYDHVVLTNGAAGAVTIAMRAYKALGFDTCCIADGPYFANYPDMIRASGLTPERGLADDQNRVWLVDSPSNPIGKHVFPESFIAPIIWDAVYSNRVYTQQWMCTPSHDVACGSYSKLIGINGVRIGWIAMDDDKLYSEVKRLTTAEYCGLSAADTSILLNILPTLDWDAFERKAQFNLNLNREEWSKLEKYFGGVAVPEVGMFYLGSMDKQCKKLIEKAGLNFRPGSKIGITDDFGRFNIGQDMDLIRKAVSAVLKADSLK